MVITRRKTFIYQTKHKPIFYQVNIELFETGTSTKTFPDKGRHALYTKYCRAWSQFNLLCTQSSTPMKSTHFDYISYIPCLRVALLLKSPETAFDRVSRQ